MANSETNTCPKCGSNLPLAKLWWNASSARGMMLTPRTGIVCPSCGTKLVPLGNGGGAVAMFLVLVLASAVVTILILLLPLVSDVAFIVAIAVPAIGGVALHPFIAAKFTTVRLAGTDEDLTYPLSDA
jgi:hypothetical protein